MDYFDPRDFFNGLYYILEKYKYNSLQDVLLDKHFYITNINSPDSVEYLLVNKPVESLNGLLYRFINRGVLSETQLRRFFLHYFRPLRLKFPMIFIIDLKAPWGRKVVLHKIGYQKPREILKILQKYNPDD